MVSLEQVRAALALQDFDALAAQRRMAPQPRVLRRSATRSGTPRQASVLLLLYPMQEQLAFALVRRALNPHDVHSGQIGLPGGSRDEGEIPRETALRETREELGVPEADVQLVGDLTCLYIPPSDFQVRPFVGYVSYRPVWRPNEAEIVGVLECRLDWLLDDARKVVEDWEFPDRTLQVPWYDVQGYKVWGATAIILSELEQRVRQVAG